MRALLIIFSVLLGSCDLPEEPVVLQEKPVDESCEWRPFGKIIVKDCRTKTPTRPQKCQYLLREPDPDTWDAVKEEYPPNREWEDCMGVGRKPRVM